MGLPFMVAIAAVLLEQGKSGPPDVSRDESVEATQARNRIREIVDAVDDVQYQDPQVPASAFDDPDRMDDLYSRVQEMKPEDIGVTHATWESIRNKLDQGLPNFKADIGKAIADKWTGDAGSAAAQGIADYIAKSGDLLGSVQLVAEKVKIVRSAIDITKPAVQEAPDSTWSSNVASWVPGPTWKLNQHRDEQYHDANVNVVKNVFYPAVKEADTQVPLVPKPYNPIHQSTDQPIPSQPTTGPPGQQPTSGSKPDSGDKAGPGSEDDPRNTEPSAANPTASKENTTDPASTAPASANAPTTPAAANQDSRTDPSSNRPGDNPRAASGMPGVSSPGGAGSPAGAGSSGTPSPGRSVQGVPGAAAGVSAGAANRASSGRSGTSGLPGMGGFSPRGKSEDDKDHQTKEYLVNQQNGEELTGLDEASRAKTVPPVIGE